MPQYISVNDQGFFKPFEALGHGIATAAGLIDAGKTRKQQASQFAQSQKMDADRLKLAQDRYATEKPGLEANAEESKLKNDEIKRARILRQVDLKNEAGTFHSGKYQGADQHFPGQDLGAGSLDFAPQDFPDLAPDAREKASRELPWKPVWNKVNLDSSFEELPANTQRFLIGQVNQAAEKAGYHDPISSAEVAKAYAAQRTGMPTLPGLSLKKAETIGPRGEKLEYGQGDGSLTEKPILNEKGEPSGYVKIGDDIKPQATSAKLTEGDKALQMNMSQLRENLGQLKKVIKDFGNVEVGVPDMFASGDRGKESGMTSTEAAALLKSLPYRSAIGYAKVVDPATAARESEVESAAKYAIPLGITTPSNVTLAAIDSMLSELDRREKENTSLRDQQGLPQISLGPKVSNPDGGVPVLWTAEDVAKHKSGPFKWGPTGQTGSK